ncbi:unnamed protein product [Fraxinus pennsylvanica]|uniref:Legume lectin domain-containing protein n=1 Tax=Fraxinus pennsylvanica TaxID=56036 RepID=A0AAD1ZYC9_9LAMI|nr:unnamed protein product [Fraxinus pennsylvanica]
MFTSSAYPSQLYFKGPSFSANPHQTSTITPSTPALFKAIKLAFLALGLFKLLIWYRVATSEKQLGRWLDLWIPNHGREIIWSFKDKIPENLRIFLMCVLRILIIYAYLGNAGGYLGLVNSSQLTKNKFIAIEFSKQQDLLFYDPNDNQVGLDINSIISIKTANMMLQSVNLKSGNLITAWIYYMNEKKLEFPNCGISFKQDCRAWSPWHCL